MAKTCSIGFRSGEYFRQEKKLCSCSADELSHSFALVTAQIVQDHDIAGTKGWDKDLLNINLEAFAIDRALK